MHSGEQVPCRCPGAPHVHGTVRAYAADRCRCGRCREAKSEYARRQNRTGGALVPAGAPRARLHRLRQAGLSYRAVSDLTGISVRALAGLTNGYAGVPVRYVFAATAASLESVTYRQAAAVPVNPLSHTDPRQARARLQSLYACGWGAAAIAGASAVGVQTIYRVLNGAGLTAGSAAKLDSAYPQLLVSAPPQNTPAQRRQVRRAQERAARSGWFPDMGEDTWPAAA